MIRIEPGKDNRLGWMDDRSFDIHDGKGKIGHLTGYLGGPWSDAETPSEFRVTYVEISEPGRRLSPGEWKDVLQGLRERLPAEAELVGGNLGGEGGDLHPAYEKLFRLPAAARAPEKPIDIETGPSPVDPSEASDDRIERLRREGGSDHGRGEQAPRAKAADASGPGHRRIRDTTRNLINAVLLDVWPSHTAIVDFGLESQEHLDAIYYPLRHGDITPEQVDAAMGNGRELTALARASPSNPHKDIAFRTGRDDLRPEPEDSTRHGGAESPGHLPRAARTSPGPPPAPRTGIDIDLDR